MVEEIPKDDRKWTGLSLDELKKRRREALRLEEEANKKAAEINLQVEMYQKAVADLKERALRAEAQHREFKTLGDVEAAANMLKFYDELEKKVGKNSRSASEKAQILAEYEREALMHRELASRLEAHIKSRLWPFGEEF